MKRKRPIPRVHGSLVRLGLTAAGAHGVVMAYRIEDPHLYWLCQEILKAAFRRRHECRRQEISPRERLSALVFR